MRVDLSVESRISAEAEVGVYKRRMQQMLASVGVYIPGLDRSNILELQDLLTLHHRQQLSMRVLEQETEVQRLQAGGEAILMLYEGIEERLNYPSVNQRRRDELVSALTAQVRYEVLQQIGGAGAVTTTKRIPELIDKSKESGDQVLGLFPKKTERSSVTALVKVDDEVVERCVRAYLILEATYRIAVHRIEREERTLERMISDLKERGGELTPEEEERLIYFLAGADETYSIGGHKADLDFLRFLGEAILKGRLKIKPKKKKDDEK